MIDFDTSTTKSADAVDVHRNAYNAAFYELGLRWHWDEAIYQSVQCRDGERACLRAYLEKHQPRLLSAYDADFLIDAILQAKERCMDTMTADGCQAGAYINWAELQQCQVGF